MNESGKRDSSAEVGRTKRELEAVRAGLADLLRQLDLLLDQLDLIVRDH